MSVFNNQQRSGYDEIASYGPRYLLDLREMDAIYRFAGYTIDLMAADLEGLITNQFISSMNLEALKRFNDFLGIQASGMTLTELKKVTSATYNGAGKMSRDKIISIVNEFLDCECTVSFADTTLTIHIVFSDDPALYMSSMRKLINQGMPAHISVSYAGYVDISIVFHINNTVPVVMWLYESFTNVNQVRVTDRHICDVVHDESVTASVTTAHDLWTLNGSNLLDGTRILDAYILKEDL